MGEYVLVDPLMDYERFLPSMIGVESRIKFVIDTHVHADHISGTREVQRISGAKLFMHDSSQVDFPFEPLRSDTVVNLCGLDVRVIHTPGHAPEHVSLLVDDRFLLSGDVMLIKDVGRTDLGRGDNTQLYQSLFEKLLRLEDRIEVFPAHVGAQHFVTADSSSTIGIEKHLNPALQVKGLEAFQRYMTEGWPPKPTNYELYVQVNRGELDLGEAQSQIQRAALGEARQAEDAHDEKV